MLQAMLSYWGERCEEYVKGCVVCSAWAEYDAAQDALRWKAALEAGGVDNWEWYSESLQKANYFQDEDY